MQSRRLGPTGLRVSRLGLGTLTWGDVTDEHEAREQLEMFLEAGGSLVDTAPGYGSGHAEELLGSLLAETGMRDAVVLATKAGLVGTGPQAPRSVDCSRSGLLRTLDSSLRRLGTDHVDLWQVHVWDDDVPLEETLATLDHAVISGRVRYAGICNYRGWQLARAATWQSAGAGRVPLASVQGEYSLLNRDLEAEVLPAARALGLGVLPAAPLGRGVLTGKYRHRTPVHSRAGDDATAASLTPYLDGSRQRIVDGVCRAADGLGWSPLEVALAWVRDRPGVVAPVVGARTSRQLAEVLRCEGRTLPSEIAHALDEISAPRSRP